MGTEGDGMRREQRMVCSTVRHVTAVLARCRFFRTLARNRCAPFAQPAAILTPAKATA